MEVLDRWVDKWIKEIRHDVIWLQIPECFEASYCIRYFFFCEDSLVRDTNLHNKDCSEMHSGSWSQMTSSCRCPISSIYLSNHLQHFTVATYVKVAGIDVVWTFFSGTRIKLNTFAISCQWDIQHESQQQRLDTRKPTATGYRVNSISSTEQMDFTMPKLVI